MKNRLRLTLFTILIIVTATLPSCENITGCTDRFSFNYNSKATKGGDECYSMGNCMGYAGGMVNSGTIGNTLYNPIYDQKMNGEVSIMRSFFNGVPANVYILYEPGIEYRNAYASPDGTILFGYHMHYYTIQNYGELPVAGVLAHEWGHRAQQTFNWNDYYRVEHKELEADAFSGFYMALRKQWAWSQIESYYANVYASGDYLYNSNNFHGTPNQRLMAAYKGVQVGVNALQYGIQYTYNQLHSIFFNEIRTNIAPRYATPPGTFAEVTYPQNLTEDYIKRLYPKIN